MRWLSQGRNAVSSNTTWGATGHRALVTLAIGVTSGAVWCYRESTAGRIV
jgi:hypothetical protein